MVGIKDFVLAADGETYLDSNTVKIVHGNNMVTLRCPAAYENVSFQVKKYFVFQQAGINHPETHTEDLVLKGGDVRTYTVKEGYFDAGRMAQIVDEDYTFVFVRAMEIYTDDSGNPQTREVQPPPPVPPTTDGDTGIAAWLKKNWWIIALLIGIIVAIGIFCWAYSSGRLG